MTYGIEAGTLCHRIDIEFIKDDAPDDAGQPVNQWGKKISNVPCEIMHKSGGEFQRGDQMEARVDVVIRIRNPGNANYPTPQMRCVTRNLTPAETYNIVYVKRADARGRELHLLCRTVI